MTDAQRNTEIEEFILDNYPPASSSEPKDAGNWAGWAAEHGFLFLCYDKPGDEGKLVGLTIARPLSIQRKIADISDFDFDRHGEVIYVDITISTAGKDAMKAMMRSILSKMGHKPLLVFKRLKTRNCLKIYRLADFAGKILGGI